MAKSLTRTEDTGVIVAYLLILATPSAFRLAMADDTQSGGTGRHGGGGGDREYLHDPGLRHRRRQHGRAGHLHQADLGRVARISDFH